MFFHQTLVQTLNNNLKQCFCLQYIMRSNGKNYQYWPWDRCVLLNRPMLKTTHSSQCFSFATNDKQPRPRQGGTLTVCTVTHRPLTTCRLHPDWLIYSLFMFNIKTKIRIVDHNTKQHNTTHFFVYFRLECLVFTQLSFSSCSSNLTTLVQINL